MGRWQQTQEYATGVSVITRVVLLLLTCAFAHGAEWVAPLRRGFGSGFRSQITTTNDTFDGGRGPFEAGRVAAAHRRRLQLACPEGEVPVNNVCTPCPGGTFWRVTSTAEDEAVCTLCPAGTFSVPGAVELASCRPCPPGFYAGNPGSGVCTSCGADTTTIETGATKLSDCYCDAGFKLPARGTNADATIPLQCVPCAPHEWCVPGEGSTAWTVADYCNATNWEVIAYGKPALCDETPGTLGTQGKCVTTFQCPTDSDVRAGQPGCLPPYRGFKCSECRRGYGVSLTENAVVPCARCWTHYLTLGILTVAISCVVVWALMMLQENKDDVVVPLVLWRIFLGHWHLITALRTTRMMWRGWSAGLMRFFALGFPLAEILTCIVQEPAQRISSYYVALQILGFFPLILVVWSVPLGVIARHLTKHATSTAFDTQRSMRPSEGGDDEKDVTSFKHRGSMFSRLMSTVGSRTGFKLAPAHLGSLTLGAFICLYHWLLVSLGRPLFRGVQCVVADATRMHHYLPSLGLTCTSDEASSLRTWVTVAIVLWVWVVPVSFVLLAWYYIPRTIDKRKKRKHRRAGLPSLVWGSFTAGMRHGVRCWHCIMMLRIPLVMTILGSRQEIYPQRVTGTLGTHIGIIYDQPQKGDVGSATALMVCFAVYAVTEVVREICMVDVYAGTARISQMSRLSTLALLVTFAAAVATQFDTTGIYGLSSAFNLSGGGPQLDLRQWGLGTITAVAAVTNLFFVAYSAYRVLGEVK